MRGRSPELWLPGGTPAPQTWRRTLEVCMWSGPAFQGCHSAPVKRALPAGVALPDFLTEPFQPWLLQGFKAQTKLSLLHQGSANMFYKGPDSKYFRLYRLCSLGCNHSTVL